MIVKELNINCIWGGTLAGFLLKGNTDRTTTKIIGTHGWLDNLNSLLPLAERLIEHHPNYEIYLYDRSGHGFSSHIGKGADYSYAYAIQDLRTIVKTLGWDKETFSLIGHSFGAMLAMTYAASYPDEVACVVAIDALIRGEVSLDLFWKSFGSRLDFNLKFLSNSSKSYKDELTWEKAIEHTKSSRPGLTDEAAKLLLERAVRRDKDGKLYFTRDQSLKTYSLFQFSNEMVLSVIRAIKASILFIGSYNPQYPRAHQSLDLLRQYHPNFEMTLIDGPHHLHMTHVNEVAERIGKYFDKYHPQTAKSITINSKL